MSIGNQLTLEVKNLIEENRKSKRQYSDSVADQFRAKRATKAAAKTRRNVRRTMRDQ